VTSQLLELEVLRRLLEFTLGAVIGMVDETLAWTAMDDRRIESRGDELGPHVARHAPADDSPAPGVSHRGEVAEARPGRERRDVGDPEPVGAVSNEVALDEVRERGGVLVADRRAHEPSAVDACEPVPAHEPGDPLARDMSAHLGQVLPDPGHAVCASAPDMEASDLGSKLGVGELTC